jgi:nucleoside-diphosphate-sugar epimerase
VRILLTGASGFLGQAAMRSWTALGHDVVAVRRQPDSAAGPAVVWDMSTPPTLEDFPSGIDAIVHMAQSRAYRDFPRDNAEMVRVNVVGLQALLDLGAALGVRRFCLISSGNVYEPYVRLDEDAPLAPPGYLGASKLAAEILARPYEGLFDLTILRLFQPYGPGQTGRLIPDLIRRVREGVPITVAQDGEGMRISPTYVDDVNAVVLDALTQGWRGTFNVASPEALSIRQMGEAIARALGVQPAYGVGHTPSVAVVPRLDRLAAMTSLSRFRSFEEGIRQTLGLTAVAEVAGR